MNFTFRKLFRIFLVMIVVIIGIIILWAGKSFIALVTVITIAQRRKLFLFSNLKIVISKDVV